VVLRLSADQWTDLHSLTISNVRKGEEMSAAYRNSSQGENAQGGIVNDCLARRDTECNIQINIIMFFIFRYPAYKGCEPHSTVICGLSKSAT
jgi:hypothetical protein